MGWSIQEKKLKSGQTRYRVHCSMANDFITGWVDRNGFLRFYRDHLETKMKTELIKEAMSFPEGWPVKGTCRSRNTGEGTKEFYEWHIESLKRDNYLDIVEQRYLGVIDKIDGPPEPIVHVCGPRESDLPPDSPGRFHKNDTGLD